MGWGSWRSVSPKSAIDTTNGFGASIILTYDRFPPPAHFPRGCRAPVVLPRGRGARADAAGGVAAGGRARAPARHRAARAKTGWPRPHRGGRVAAQARERAVRAAAPGRHTAQ